VRQLREGYTTGVCAAAASLASVLWQTQGICPEYVALEIPAGKTLELAVQPICPYVCGEKTAETIRMRQTAVW
jgi:cobalt-precorrin-5B (C1)-methyltransferase